MVKYDSGEREYFVLNCGERERDFVLNCFLVCLVFDETPQRKKDEGEREREIYKTGVKQHNGGTFDRRRRSSSDGNHREPDRPSGTVGLY